MPVTAADFLRFGVTAVLFLLAYGRLGSVLRFLWPTRVRHEALPDQPEPAGPVAEALRAQGFRYLGGRWEAIFRLHRHVAAVYAHPDGRVVDLPLSGRLRGAYLVTQYQDGRCAKTGAWSGREVVEDRYRSRAVGGRKTLRDLVEAHAESESAICLGVAPQVVDTLEERLELGERWYREHARTELTIPAALDGLLLGGLVAFGIYIWTL